MIPLAVLLPAIAGIMVVEVIVVLFWPASRRKRLLPTVASGLFIITAWNASALGWPLPVVLAALTGALAAHAWDLALRW